MDPQVKSDHRRIIAKGTNANFPKLSPTNANCRFIGKPPVKCEIDHWHTIAKATNTSLPELSYKPKENKNV
jgi:hypothetical protein